jgi:anti-sigma factor RsiW
MTCTQFRDVAESYLAGELPGETGHEVVAHLDGCAACRIELESRVALRSTLREAFAHSPILAPDPGFLNDVRAALIAGQPVTPRRVGRRMSWLAIAASLMVAASVGWGLGWWSVGGGDRIPPSSIPSPAVGALSTHAAGDHRYCALEHALEEPVISMAEAARRYNPAYASLRDVVAASSAARDGGLEILGAHWCVFRGQPFGHVVGRRGGRVVSVLVTPVVEVTRESSAAACQPTDGLRVGCFGARGHGVFVVSDLEEGELLELTRMLAPVLQAHFAEA